MSNVLVHRGWIAIESRRLAWEKAIGESRWPHFGMRWSWYRNVARWSSTAWEPLLLEACWGDKPLGFVPLLAHRERPTWISPNLLTGIGPAVVIGREITATWLRIVASLENLLPPDGSLQLGPFDLRSGVASRLETAFANFPSRRPTKRTITRNEWELSSSTLTRLGPSPGQAPRQVVVGSRGSGRSHHGLDRATWDRLESLLADPSIDRLTSLDAIDAGTSVVLDSIERLAEEGLITVSHPRSNLMPPEDVRSAATIVWLGDEHDAMPLLELRPQGAAPPTLNALNDVAGQLAERGFRRLSHLPGDWPIAAAIRRHEFRTFTVAPRFDLRTALKGLTLSDMSQRFARLLKTKASSESRSH